MSIYVKCFVKLKLMANKKKIYLLIEEDLKSKTSSVKQNNHLVATILTKLLHYAWLLSYVAREFSAKYVLEVLALNL